MGSPTGYNLFIATTCYLWHDSRMKFDDLLVFASKQPFFETGLLLAGAVGPADVCRQLSRWTQAGRVIQLRRGLYILAAPYQQTAPHSFLITNSLLPGSYVSLQPALAYYGLIPEYAAQILGATTQRPSRWRNPLGDFRFQCRFLGSKPWRMWNHSCFHNRKFLC